MPSVCRVLNFYSSSTKNRKPRMSIKEKNVNVVVNDFRFVPYINRKGPLSQPVSIPETVANTLKKNGYKIVIMGTPKSSATSKPEGKTVTAKPSVEVEEAVKLPEDNKNNGIIQSEKVEEPKKAETIVEDDEEDEVDNAKVEEEKKVEPKKETVKASSKNNTKTDKTDKTKHN